MDSFGHPLLTLDSVRVAGRGCAAKLVKVGGGSEEEVQAMRFFHRRVGVAPLVLAGAWLALGPAGCGDPSGVGRTVPVVGKVTVAGRPVKAGTVSFRPDKSKGNTAAHEPYGEIDSEGNYKLFTGTKKAAPVGW